jgi:hypothetical protein
MSREIKFRAWDKEQEILHPVQDLQFGNNGKTHVFLALGEDICSEGFAPEKFHLMQFTGLLDKNGEEIFEKMEIDNKFIVDFQNGSYILRNISNNNIIYFYDYIKQNEKLPEITREYSEI